MTYFSGKNLILTLLLLAALATSAWLARQSFLSIDDSNISQPTTPDAFMTEARFIGFDDQGQWSNRINSPKVIHYPEQDTAVFDKPQMVARAQDQLTWIITADHGTSRQGLSVVDLADNVQVQRINDLSHKVVTLTTTALRTYPKQKLAHTNQPVTIIQPGSTVHSIGLAADLNKGEIQLLSQVHGTYEKPATP